MITLTTERLRLRPWRDDDLEPFAALNADPEVMRYFPSTLPRERSDAVARRVRDHFDRHGYGFWAVERLDVPAPFVGILGLAEVDFEASFTPCVEVAWRLARAHQGVGLATEGARAALAWGFGTLGLDEIVALAVPENRPSRRVMEKLGMRFDGEFDHPRLPDGHPLRRHVLYRCSAEDWRASVAR